MIFRSVDLARELRTADWRLLWLVEYTERIAQDYGWEIEITSVTRTAAETRRIYEAAGLEPPAASVHGTVPTRGADGVPHLRPGGELRARRDEVGWLVANRVNARVRYPRGRRAVLWHDIQGQHWHFQVPWDGLELLPAREE